MYIHNTHISWFKTVNIFSTGTMKITPHVSLFTWCCCFFLPLSPCMSFCFITAKEVVYKWHVVTVTAWPWFKTKNPWRNMSTPGVWAHLVSWAFQRSSCRTTDGNMFSQKGSVEKRGVVIMVLRCIISYHIHDIWIWYSCLVHCVFYVVVILYLSCKSRHIDASPLHIPLWNRIENSPYCRRKCV